MLSREEGYKVSIPWDSTEGLLRRYTLAMTNVFVSLTDPSNRCLRSHSQRARDLRRELAERLPPDAVADEIAQADRYARAGAQDSRAMLARASRYRGHPAEPQEIVAGLTVTVTRAEAGLMRGLVQQMADARMQFRAATWRGELATALRAEAAWNRLAGQMAEAAGQGADQVRDWLSAFRAKIDAYVETEAAGYRAQFDL